MDREELERRLAESDAKRKFLEDKMLVFEKEKQALEFSVFFDSDKIKSPILKNNRSQVERIMRALSNAEPIEFSLDGVTKKVSPLEDFKDLLVKLPPPVQTGGMDFSAMSNADSLNQKDEEEMMKRIYAPYERKR